MIAEINIHINRCSNGIYLRWWHSQGGWHYFLVNAEHDASVKVDNTDIITEVNFSRISKVESVVYKDIDLTYKCAAMNLKADEKDALVGMLECETVQWYRHNIWQDIDIERKSFTTKETRANAYNIEFEFTFENYLDDL